MPRGAAGSEADMAEQAKKGGKPAVAPDQGKVSDAELEKVSGGTSSPHTQTGWTTADWPSEAPPAPSPVPKPS